jgi:acetyl esterase
MDAVSEPVETLTPDAARQASRARREANPVPVQPVAAVADREIPGPAGPLPIRIYRPSEEAGLPVIVFFHGGGWVLCDLDSHDGICRLIANGSGAVVVSVDYRLAPEHVYPAAVDDAYAATVWVSEHADELQVDADRLAVMGDSAGGNLAAAVALMARDRSGPRIAFQSLLYPVIDHDFTTSSYEQFATDYFLTSAAMQWYWDQYVAEGQRDEPYVSPIHAADLSGLPATHLLTAECDPLRDEGMAYAARLAEAGVPVESKVYEGAFHGFFGMAAALSSARAANADAIEALRKGLS